VPTQNAVGGEVQESPAEHKEVEFMTAVLNDVQGFWAQTLPNVGVPYRDAKLVLFRDITDSGCGTAQSATGPFYCPLDQKVYIDLSFFNELRQRLGAKGDFAEAYVLAHELGHHVQHLMGTDARVRQLQESRPELGNDLSVRLELQADCYAGVWAHSSNQRQNLEPGDIDEALGAAAAVGDDRLQRMTRGTVQPESFTHGTSAQRSTWFKRGFEGGRVESCDTFAGGR
jgi:predicted metalloprotease